MSCNAGAVGIRSRVLWFRWRGSECADPGLQFCMTIGFVAIRVGIHGTFAVSLSNQRPCASDAGSRIMPSSRRASHMPARTIFRWWESARLPVLSTLGKWAQGQASMLKIGHFGAVRHAERSHDTCNKRLCYCLVHGVALRDMSDTRNTDNKRTKWGQLQCASYGVLPVWQGVSSRVACRTWYFRSALPACMTQSDPMALASDRRRHQSACR